MSTKRINFKESRFSKTALAISSTADIFRIAWSLGQIMDLDFKNEEDCIPAPSKRKEIFQVFSAADENEIVFRLTENRSGNAVLSKKYKQFDYFLLTSDNSFTPDIKKLKTLISKAESIQAVFIIEVCNMISKAFSPYSF